LYAGCGNAFFGFFLLDLLGSLFQIFFTGKLGFLFFQLSFLGC
jgi:hypothetical protein